MTTARGTTVVTHDREPAPRASQGWLLWLGLFAAAAALYMLTADGQPQWQDSGEMQYRIIKNQLDHPGGLALVHLVQFYIGRASLWLLPGVEPSLSITWFVSSIPGAIAIANVGLALFLITHRVAAAVIAAVGLALAHTIWQMSTITECYGVTMALLSLEWVFLGLLVRTARSRWLIGTWAANGLGVANHMLSGLAGPANLIFTLAWTLRCKNWLLLLTACALAWIVGVSPYLWLIIEKAQATGDWGLAVRSALVGEFASAAANTRITSVDALLGVGYPLYNFPGLLLIVAAYGAAASGTSVRWLLIGQAALFYLFAFRYRVPDSYAFFFPFYMTLAMLAGLGLAQVQAWPGTAARRLVLAGSAVSALWTPLVYMGTTHLLRSRGMLASMVKNKPYRDGYTAFFLPWGAARDYARKVNSIVYRHAGPNGLVVLEDSMMYFGTLYDQATGRASDDVKVQFMDPPSEDPQQRMKVWRSKVRQAISEGRPVVVVPSDKDKPGEWLTGASLRKDGYILIIEELPPEGP